MYNVYVLRSLKNGKKYVGFTSKDVEARLKEHNKGSNVWARHNRPFELIHAECYNTKRRAISREKFLKSGRGRKELEDLLRARSSIG